MTLNEHDQVLSCAIRAVHGQRLCSSFHDTTTIQLWNVSSGRCERTLEGHTSIVTDMILLLDGRLWSVCSNGSIKIWNIETGLCDLTVYASNYLSKVIQLDDGRLVASGGRKVYVIGE
jgi:WD40 repeat protein